MTCDASKVLSTLQDLALETSDRDVLARALVSLLLDAFVRASRVGLWWKSADGLKAGPSDGPSTSEDTAREDRDRVMVAVSAAQDAILADIECPEARSPLGPRSRIVVLIRSMGDTVGALDIASVEPQAFGEVDRCVLRAVADSFGGLIAASRIPGEED